MTNMDHIMVHMGELGRVKRRAVPKKERHGSLFLYKPTKQPDQGHMAQTWIEMTIIIRADEDESEWVSHLLEGLTSLCFHIVNLVGSLCAPTDINVRRFCGTCLVYNNNNKLTDAKLSQSLLIANVQKLLLSKVHRASFSWNGSLCPLTDINVPLCADKQTSQIKRSQRMCDPPLSHLCDHSTNRVAKCQFFTQIISVQLNLPQEKVRKSRQGFDV